MDHGGPMSCYTSPQGVDEAVRPTLEEPDPTGSFSRLFSVFPARPVRRVLSVPPSLIPVPYQERGGGVACVRGRVGEGERGERGGARSASGS